MAPLADALSAFEAQEANSNSRYQAHAFRHETPFNRLALLAFNLQLGLEDARQLHCKEV